MDEFVSIPKNEAGYLFSKIPKKLLYNNEKTKLSCEAMILYTVMLDRFSLSCENGWKNRSGKIYILCSIKEAQKIIMCSYAKTVKIFKELADKQLIFREKQGRCMPDRIYINEKFLFDDQNWITIGHNIRHQAMWISWKNRG